MNSKILHFSLLKIKSLSNNFSLLFNIIIKMVNEWSDRNLKCKVQLMLINKLAFSDIVDGLAFKF